MPSGSTPSLTMAAAPTAPSAVAAGFLLNGRFLDRAPTGVDRVAAELGRALVERTSCVGRRLRIARTPDGKPIGETWPPELQAIGQIRVPWLGGHAWEQLSLASAEPQDWLLSLCNSGPILRRRQVVMIHDAQIHLFPESYSRPFRMFYNQMQPRVARRAQILVTVSGYSRQKLEQFGVAPPGKAEIIPNGADHIDRVVADGGTLERFGLPRGGYFLSISSLARHKNLALLNEVAPRRADTSIPLVIVGGGNKQVFSEGGVTEGPGLRLLGRVSDGELKALYSGARALLFPSLTEGFGLPALEAMRSGCPVIATTGGAVPEVCGDAALFADPERPEDWIAAMEALSTDELRERLVATGLARSATFTWRAAADKLISLIQAAEDGA